jgi:hypothetical protein
MAGGVDRKRVMKGTQEVSVLRQAAQSSASPEMHLLSGHCRVQSFW